MIEYSTRRPGRRNAMIEAAKLQSRLGYTTGIACLNEQAKVDVDALLGCFPGVYARSW